MIRSRKSPSNSSPSLLSASSSQCFSDDSSPIDNGKDNGKENRRLFETRSSSIMGRSNSNNLLLLVSLLVATNLTVGLSVYWWMSSTPTSTSTLSIIESPCPKDMVGFANWFSDNLDPKRKASFKDIRIVENSNKKKKTRVPSKFRKTFYYDGNKISHPIARAFRSRGWVQVDDTDNAHVIYTYSNHAYWAQDLQPWQRFNFIPNLEKWNEKSNFVYYYKKYEKEKNKAPSVYVPESYMLTDTRREIEAFRNVLLGGNGKDHPWVHKLSAVNQGKGITIMAPNSPGLMALPDKSMKAIEDGDKVQESIIQRYICNEMTWNQRKFDVRMYWIVASLDPLIVLYHDGYVRVGNSVYSETSFHDTTAHLTSHTGLGAETKTTFAQFEQNLNEKHKQNEEKSKNEQSKRRGARSFKELPNGNTPVEHVRNQFKHALGEMIEIMKDESFAAPDLLRKHKTTKRPELTSENSFQFYCADYILDNDLDVWFIEPQVCYDSLFHNIFVLARSLFFKFLSHFLFYFILILNRMGADWTKIITLDLRCTLPCSTGWSMCSRKLDKNRKPVNRYFRWKNLGIGK